MPPSEAAASIPAAARVYRYDSGLTGPVFTREIAVETPIEIAFGGAPFAVMMATPLDLEDFAYGFALTEGAVDSVADIRAVEVEVGGDSARIDIALSGPAMGAHLARKRALSGRSGCGLCGIEDLAHLPKPRTVQARARAIEPRAIGAALASLDKSQPLNARTHAAHAAAWCDAEGALVAAREDVGRHNALDKLIGALLRAKAEAGDGFLLLTSRCSYEMVVKAAAFGAGTLVSISAPTTLALSAAANAGISLFAVARADSALEFQTSRTESGAAA
jgi:FdhD protein